MDLGSQIKRESSQIGKTAIRRVHEVPTSSKPTTEVEEADEEEGDEEEADEEEEPISEKLTLSAPAQKYNSKPLKPTSAPAPKSASMKPRTKVEDDEEEEQGDEEEEPIPKKYYTPSAEFASKPISKPSSMKPVPKPSSVKPVPKPSSAKPVSRVEDDEEAPVPKRSTSSKPAPKPISNEKSILLSKPIAAKVQTSSSKPVKPQSTGTPQSRQAADDEGMRQLIHIALIDASSSSLTRSDRPPYSQSSKKQKKTGKTLEQVKLAKQKQAINEVIKRSSQKSAPRHTLAKQTTEVEGDEGEGDEEEEPIPKKYTPSAKPATKPISKFLKLSSVKPASEEEVEEGDEEEGDEEEEEDEEEKPISEKLTSSAPAAKPASSKPTTKVEEGDEEEGDEEEEEDEEEEPISEKLTSSAPTPKPASSKPTTKVEDEDERFEEEEPISKKRISSVPAPKPILKPLKPNSAKPASEDDVEEGDEEGEASLAKQKQAIDEIIERSDQNTQDRSGKRQYSQSKRGRIEAEEDDEKEKRSLPQSKKKQPAFLKKSSIVPNSKGSAKKVQKNDKQPAVVQKKGAQQSFVASAKLVSSASTKKKPAKVSHIPDEEEDEPAGKYPRKHDSRDSPYQKSSSINYSHLSPESRSRATKEAFFSRSSNNKNDVSRKDESFFAEFLEDDASSENPPKNSPKHQSSEISKSYQPPPRGHVFVDGIDITALAESDFFAEFNGDPVKSYPPKDSRRHQSSEISESYQPSGRDATEPMSKTAPKTKEAAQLKKFIKGIDRSSKDRYRQDSRLKARSRGFGDTSPKGFDSEVDYMPKRATQKAKYASSRPSPDRDDEQSPTPEDDGEE